MLPAVSSLLPWVSQHLDRSTHPLLLGKVLEPALTVAVAILLTAAVPQMAVCMQWHIQPLAWVEAMEHGQMKS
jgi:hypothetical protein